MATMRELNGKINEAREAILEAQRLADCLTVDPCDVASEIGLLKATVKGQARKLDFYQGIVDKLKASRKAVREVLGAGSLERTADAAKRIYNSLEQACRELADLRTQLRISRANAAKLALSTAGTDGKDKRNVSALRKARDEVRKILGAKKGESTRDAARRVANLVDGNAVFLYNELDKLAVARGFNQGSVLRYLRSFGVPI